MLKLTTLSLALTAAVATFAGAQTTARVSVSPESKLWIEGTSNLHEWSCTTNALDAAIDVDAAAAAQLGSAAPKMLKKVLVKVPVTSLKCNHRGMDGNVYKALKADQTAEISYILATFEPAGETKEGFTLKTVGKLTIAGVENSINLDVVAERLADGSVKATGMVPIKMTEYGIKPPTALFGRLKTGDEVKVKFELTVGSKALAAALNDK